MPCLNQKFLGGIVPEPQHRVFNSYIENNPGTNAIYYFLNILVNKLFRYLLSLLFASILFDMSFNAYLVYGTLLNLTNMQTNAYAFDYENEIMPLIFHQKTSNYLLRGCHQF